jgi:hypothetical protein
MTPVVGGGVDAGGDTLHQEGCRAIEAGRVTGDGDSDDDGAHRPECRKQ